MQNLKKNLTDTPVGDGSAVFFSDGTDDEFKEYDYLENKGWKGFVNKIKNL